MNKTSYAQDIHYAIDSPLRFISEWMKTEFDEYKNVPSQLISVSIFHNGKITTKTINSTKKDIEFCLLYQLTKRPHEAVFFNENLIFGGINSTSEFSTNVKYNEAKKILSNKQIMV